MFLKAIIISSFAATSTLAHPALKQNANHTSIADPSFGPIPGESNLYNTYIGTAAPFPATHTAAIPATEAGPPAPDDQLWQNLLSAEWAVYSFYQQAVSAFNTTSFTELGLPNTTYDRITSIRDNEAGHLRIFQDQISATSLKPGGCSYEYGWNNASEWLALQVTIEVTSIAFLTGLVTEATTTATASALVAVAAVESRHNAWALIDVWNTDPFAGPADTVFPYAREILDITNRFIVPGSCPADNPGYPSPNQNLPELSFDATTTTAQPGSNITFTFPKTEPVFQDDTEYFAVFFHGVINITVAFESLTNASVVPSEFDKARGIIIVVIADEVGADTLDSVVAGPLILLEQPQELTLEV